jgi:2'-5' RNA ligase
VSPEPRSAVIVTVAIPSRIEAIRRRHVPVALLGVPPHVTILSPFVAAGTLDRDVRRRLAAAISDTPAFDVRFGAVERFDDALYLAPVPEAPFRDLIRVVSRAFPGYPPYSDASYQPEDVIPHLTIAIGDGTGFDGYAREAARALPLERRVRAVTVLAEDAEGRWRTRWRLRLRR